MCGISIIVKNRETAICQAHLEKMTSIIAHRGPDHQGIEFFNSVGQQKLQKDEHSSNWEIGLGHRRLSILDLSAAGHQPMMFNGNWITYNGEVYNYKEIRKELIGKGYTFTSNTDTEVILKSYQEWGTDCFERFNGMWSLGIYDTIKNKLVISRDRIGIKPLYIFQQAELLICCSEIKQIKSLPNINLEVDQETLSTYLKTGYEFYNSSFYQNVTPFEPGHFAQFDFSTRILKQEAYWHPKNISLNKNISITESAEYFRELFSSSIELRQQSDVKVGGFLSGGLDSSIITQTSSTVVSPEKFNTFSSVFKGFEMDERQFIERIQNNNTSIKGHFITPTVDSFVNEYKKMIWHNDEPVGGPSVFASYAVSKLARSKNTTVILNGQGGDEVFGGYWQMYFSFLLNKLKQGKIFSTANHFISSLLPKGNQTLIRQIPFILKRYFSRAKHFDINLIKNSESSYLIDYFNLSQQEKRIYELRYMFLPRLLKWEDRNTMAFSLEGRYPFLDHRLLDFCLSLPSDRLYKSGWTKMPLRIAYEDCLPREIIWRKSKYGFEVPQNKWLDQILIKDRMFDDETSKFWTLIEKKEMQKIIEQYTSNRNYDLAQLIYRLIFTKAWMDL